MAPRQEVVHTGFSAYDTFDGQLAREGWLLIGTGDKLCLLGEKIDPIWQRGALPGFTADMGDGPVREVLLGIVSPLRRLMLIGEGDLDCRLLALLDDEHKTRVRCECWTFMTKAGPTITRIALQGVRGYDKAFSRLCARLGGFENALSVEMVAGRLFPGTTGYAAKPAIDIAPDGTAFDTAGDIIRNYIAVARQNEDGVIEDIDSEFLHDYRIALRKIRSVLSLFRNVYAADFTDDLKARFNTLMARSGRLRDLDVYLIQRETYLDLVPRDMQPGLKMLFEEFAAERTIEQRRFAAHLRSDGYRREMRDLIRLFDTPDSSLPKGPKADQPALDYARVMIWKRYRKVCATAAIISDATPDEQIHELRIHCKKLRYLIEFFAPLFAADEIRILIKPLKKLQDTLGDFNDCSVQQEALANILDGLDETYADRKLEIAKSVGALLTMLDQRQKRARGQVTAYFMAFDSPATRDGFERLFRTGGGAS
ncbi:CHAD domain-containing protein [Paracoccus alkanivorans]|nr:CHAD domain-containing protein [Paracoccus alkanivorans]